MDIYSIELTSINEAQASWTSLPAQIDLILINYGWFLASFDRNQEISWESALFPAGNFLVPNFLFPVFLQEICHSIQQWRKGWTLEDSLFLVKIFQQFRNSTFSFLSKNERAIWHSLTWGMIFHKYFLALHICNLL